jgi:hypothetical protein
MLVSATGGMINCFIVEISAPLLALLSAPDAVHAPSIAFVVVARRARFSCALLIIGPTVCGFHQLGDIF